MSNLFGKITSSIYTEMTTQGIFWSGYMSKTKMPILHPGDIGIVAIVVFEDSTGWARREVDWWGRKWKLAVYWRL